MYILAIPVKAWWWAETMHEYFATTSAPVNVSTHFVPQRHFSFQCCVQRHLRLSPVSFSSVFPLTSPHSRLVTGVTAISVKIAPLPAPHFQAGLSLKKSLWKLCVGMQMSHLGTRILFGIIHFKMFHWSNYWAFFSFSTSYISNITAAIRGRAVFYCSK